MAAFHYIALDAQGQRQKGVLEADTERQIRQQLRSKGMVPVEVRRVKEHKKTKRQSFFSRKKLKYNELTLITRQMATLLAAGMPLDEVLYSVAGQSEKDHVKSVLLGVRAKVAEGFSLASGMGEFPQAFPELYRITVASGEKSGKLDQVLLELAEYTENQQRIRRKVQQALIYPSLMTLVSISIVIFLLLYVVPKIVGVFHQTGHSLPTITMVLITISHFLQRYGLYLLGLLALLGWWFKRSLKKTGFRRRYYDWVLRLPVIGKAVKTINTARFARTFGILHAATVPVLDAMGAAAELITPLSMREAVNEGVEKVKTGVPINKALQGTGYFPPILVHLVASGEASGRLDEMLTKAAADQEQDVEALIQTSLTLFEPVLILLMGAIVLFIVLAVMLPIFDLDTFSGG